MLVYKDVISGDEVLSDSFEFEEVCDGLLYEVPGKWVISGTVDVDIGANPSAEEGGDEAVEDGAKKVVDVVDTFRLQEQLSFSKKQFLAYIKAYVKTLEPLIPSARVPHFKAKAGEAVKYLLAKLKDLQFFVGETMNHDAMMVYAYYKEGATNPTFIYFRDGLKEEKY